jgi:uncharacterized surface protein with fasciclin (FAS1) repeats
MRVKKFIAGFAAASAALAGSALLAAPAQASETPTLAGLAVSASGGPGVAGTPDKRHWDFDIAVAALTATNLVGALDDPKASLSVVLPTDGAFIRSANDLIAALGLNHPKVVSEKQALDFYVTTVGLDTVEDVLLYHVVPGKKTLAELRASSPVATLLGPTFEVKQARLVDQLGRDAWILRTNLQASNGTVQVISKVILPGLPS